MERQHQDSEEAQHEELAVAAAAAHAAAVNNEGSAKAGKILTLEKIRRNQRLDAFSKLVSQRNDDVNKRMNDVTEKICDFKQLQTRNREDDEGPAAGDEAVDILQAELEAKKVEALVHLEGIHKAYDQHRSRVAQASTMDALRALDAEVAKTAKTLHQLAVQEFLASAREISRHFTPRRTRGERASWAKRAREKANTVAGSPLFMMLRELPERAHNLATSVNDTMAGKSGSVATVATKDFEDIAKNSMVKKALQLNAKSLKLNAKSIKKGQSFMSSLVSSQLKGTGAKMKHFHKMMQTAVTPVAPDLVSRAPPNEEDLAAEVFKFEVQSCERGYVSWGWTHMGHMESWLVLSGSIVFAGIATETIPGTNFNDKLSYVRTLQPEAVHEMIAAHGFYQKFIEGGAMEDGNNMFVVPTGFLMVQAGNNANLLRWSFSGDDEDLGRTKDTLQGLLTSFPELRAEKKGYIKYASKLGLSV